MRRNATIGCGCLKLVLLFAPRDRPSTGLAATQSHMNGRTSPSRRPRPPFDLRPSMFDVRRSMFALLVLGLCCTFGVAVRCDCLSVDHEQLSNPNGVPGQFSYSFNFVNNTNVPMGYLYIVPVTNCMTVSPDILKFSPR